MKKKKIGIIGVTGRLGSRLLSVLKRNNYYLSGLHFTRNTSYKVTIDDVFVNNDYVIDCSHYSLMDQIIKAAVQVPKPLIICTTGFDSRIYKNLEILSSKTIVVIIPNSSFGLYVQRILVRKLAKILDSEYKISIVEKHHKNKIDLPSGSAKLLLSDIVKIKQKEYNLKYKSVLYHGCKNKNNNNKNFLKEDCNFIEIFCKRSGNIFGRHEVIFSSNYESISVKHVAFNIMLFVRGIIKILEYLLTCELPSGIYNLEDIVRRDFDFNLKNI